MQLKVQPQYPAARRTCGYRVHTARDAHNRKGWGGEAKGRGQEHESMERSSDKGTKNLHTRAHELPHLVEDGKFAEHEEVGRDCVLVVVHGIKPMVVAPSPHHIVIHPHSARMIGLKV